MAKRDKAMTIGEHLQDLRRVFVISAMAIVAATGVVYGLFRQDLYNIVVSPLKQYDVSLVYIGLTEAFFTQIKISLLAGFIISLPIILWQVWGFVAHGLKPQERKMIIWIMPLFLLLFLIGSSFAYLAVFKIAVNFLLITASPDLMPMLSISKYVSFIISFLIPFGLIFELPLITYFLVRWEMISKKWLISNRKYAIFIFFVMAAALTPGPDAISQFLMVAPMLFLYEVSILIAKLVEWRRNRNAGLNFIVSPNNKFIRLLSCALHKLIHFKRTIFRT